MILTPKQQELARWYFVENHTIAEIAAWWSCSYTYVRNELVVLRAIFASHGQELPRYNHGRPAMAPVLADTAVI